MKRKIIGIFVCMMLMTTFLTNATNGENVVLKKTAHNTIKTSSFEDDVPIWKKSVKWIFEIDDIEFGDITSGHLRLQMGELSLTVVDDSGSSYNTEFKANIGGFFEIGEEFYIKLEFINSKMEGDISFRKTDLGIEEIDIKISGRMKFTVDIPDLPFSIPKIPFRFTIYINFDFDGPFSLFDFPLNIDKIWDLPATNLTVDGEMRSLWFNFINFLNNIFHFLPDEIAVLLPVITIKQTIEYSEIPHAFTCIAKEMKTVQGGSYEAYHITVGEMGSIYYAPEIGNIIEISVENLKIELKKYTTNIKTRFV